MKESVKGYWDAIESAEQEFNKENKEYMSKVKGYMLVSSIFLDGDEELTNHLYNMYLDALEAQRNGLSAKEYFGDEPRVMADELLKNLPQMTVKKGLHFGLMMGGVYLAIQFLAEFAAEGQIHLNFASILGILFIAVGLPVIAFQLLKSVIYQTVKWKIWATYLLYPILAIIVFALNFWAIDHAPSISLSPYWSGILGTMVVLVTAFYHKEVLVRYVFLPVFLFYLISGFAQVYVKSQGISGDFWNKWFSVGVLFIEAAIFLLGTLFILFSTKRASRQERAKQGL